MGKRRTQQEAAGLTLTRHFSCILRMALSWAASRVHCGSVYMAEVYFMRGPRKAAKKALPMS